MARVEASPVATAGQDPVSVESASAQRARELIDRASRHEETDGSAYGYAMAYNLYCAAARLESPDAMVRMGWMYAEGRGRPRDDAIANTLFRRAAGVATIGDRLPECLRRPYQALTAPVRQPPQADPARPMAQPAGILAAPATAAQRKLVKTVVEMAREFRLDPRLVLAVMQAESNFDPKARSPKNAQGLMQLIPDTAERFAVRDAFDPVQNLRGGMKYLRWLLSYFRGDVALTLAGYNAGERTVDRYRGVPPYPETLAYVQRIRAMYPQDRHAYDARVVAPAEWLSGAPRKALTGNIPIASTR